ncbi:hypothetical protein FBU30_001701 [Linnemannia zychae]|nr:hypothetical protein FBU30_001701 [Linnemannia zychae]
MLKLKVAILIVMVGVVCTALPLNQATRHLETRKERKPSLYQKCIQKHRALELLKGSIMDGGVTKTSGLIPYPTGNGDPYDTSICFADPAAEQLFTRGTMIFGDGQTDIGDGYEHSRTTKNYCPVPSILAASGDKALCTFKNLNVQAQFKFKPLQFKSCAFKTCKVTKTKTATTTTEVKGEVKFAAELFKAVNMEASISGGLTNTHTFTTSEEQGSEKGDTAFEIGVSVIVQTNVDSISIAGKANHKECTENEFTTKAPVKNNYILSEHTKTIWISCDEEKPATATPAESKPKSGPTKRSDLGLLGSLTDGIETISGGVNEIVHGIESIPHALDTLLEGDHARTGRVNPAPEGGNPAPEGGNPTPEGTNPTPEGTNPTPEGTNPAPEDGNAAPENGAINELAYEDIFGDEDGSDNDDLCFLYENGELIPDVCF